MGGAGHPVVLLHGILVSSWAWRFNLGPLSRDFRVMALCQKGHGWSGKGRDPYTFASLADFVLRFLDTLGIERADLVGNSLGGGVSLRLALDHPDRVRRLVLVNPAAVPFPVGDRFLRLQSARLAPLYQAIGQRAVFQLLLRTLFYSNLAIDDAYMDGFMAPLRREDAMAAAVTTASNLQRGLRDLAPSLGRVRQPALIVWGRRDRLVGRRAISDLHSALPNAQLDVFDHCAHCPMEEDPERFNRRVSDFLGA